MRHTISLTLFLSVSLTLSTSTVFVVCVCSSTASTDCANVFCSVSRTVCPSANTMELIAQHQRTIEQ